MHGVAKVIAGIIKPLTGRKQHNIHNMQHFIKQIKVITLGTGKHITSHDVISIFTSVPVATALKVAQNKLEQDQDLQLRSKCIGQPIELLGFCLQNTCFIFKGKYYEQVEGLAMGSQVSPIIANMYMEYSEEKALRTPEKLPRLWSRHVDNTFIVQQIEHKEDFLRYINNLHHATNFTVNTHGKMVLCHSWTHYLHPNQTEPYPLVCIGNPSTQISIYTSTVIT